MKKSLSLVREAVPLIPESLDATVLANFRVQTSTPKRISLFSRRMQILGWGAAAAAALLIAATLFMTTRKPIVSMAQPALPQTQVLTKVADTRPAQPAVPTRSASSPKRPHRIVQRPALASNRRSDPPADRFRSLMYCDELACAAPMDVIRVQLPSDFVAGPARGSMPASRTVTADVLIGSDGIARGFRIVE